MGSNRPLMEWLLNHTPLTVSFLLTIRLSVAGIVLLTYLLLTGKNIFGIWQRQVMGKTANYF